VSVRLRDKHSLSLYVAAALRCHTQRIMSCILCCSVLQCVAVRCSVLQCAVVCCSVLQCVAVRCSVLQCVAVCCSVLQCVTVVQICSRGPSVSHTANHVMHSVLQCVAVCCSVLQCVAVCCNWWGYVDTARQGYEQRPNAELFEICCFVCCACCVWVHSYSQILEISFSCVLCQ